MLSTDTTWEVVQSFLNVPGMKGVALIDGRSRPYFQGIERVLNSQQREALAKGVWQVLETIPDDFESFEFQFAGTQVYIHKLSQEQILLVLTHDDLIYPDYFDAFSRLRGAFNQDSAATMEVFQRLLGARNTKVTPLNLSDLANGSEHAETSPTASSTPEILESETPEEDPSAAVSAEAEQSQEPPTLEIPTLEIPSGSADYAVAANTEITDISTAAVEPDAPANPSPPEQPKPKGAMPLEADAASGGFKLDGSSLSDSSLPDMDATDAGLPEIDGEVHGRLPDLGETDAMTEAGAAEPEAAEAGTDAASEAQSAANLFAASLTDANALVGRSAKGPSQPEPTSTSLPEEDELLAVTPLSSKPSTRNKPSKHAPFNRTESGGNEDHQADLAALMDTLALGEEDFESQDGLLGATPLQPYFPEAAEADEAVSLPQAEADNRNTQVLDPWDEPEAATAVLNEALAEDAEQQRKPQQLAKGNPSLLSVTPSVSVNDHPEQSERAEAAQPESLLNNRLDAVALDDDIEIDDLFGYGDSTTELTADPAEAEAAPLESYVESLNALGEFSAHYLGRAVIVNYWRTSRPGDEWLKDAFAIERAANSIRLGPDYAASRRSPVTEGQEAILQTWAEQFVKRCSKVIRDFPQLAQQALSEEQSQMLNL